MGDIFALATMILLGILIYMQGSIIERATTKREVARYFFSVITCALAAVVCFLYVIK